MANQFINDLPDMLWDHKVIPYLTLKDLALTRSVAQFFGCFWQDRFMKNKIPLRVPEDISISNVMVACEQFNKLKVFTKEDPLVVQLGRGVHRILQQDINGSMYRINSKTLVVSCSNITFVGQGSFHDYPLAIAGAGTTVLGSFIISNQTDVSFKHIQVQREGEARSQHGLEVLGPRTVVDVSSCRFDSCQSGIYCKFGATITASNCEFVNNDFSGMVVVGSNAILTNCKFQSNAGDGISILNHSIVDFFGEQTDISSNQIHGYFLSEISTVKIHLASNHNTSHDHIGQLDYVAPNCSFEYVDPGN